MISVVSILEGFIDEPPLEENDNLFDLESKKNEWKKILYDAPIDDVIFGPGGDIDEINAFLDIDISTDIEDGYHDSEGDILYLESLVSNDTILSLSPKMFLDHDPRSLSDINDLKIMVKIFDPGIWEIIFSPTYVKLPFEDCNYLSFTYVIQICLLCFTYPVEFLFLLSSGSEDTIFDPGIPIFSLEPVVSHRSGTFMCFNVYLNFLNESPKFESGIVVSLYIPRGMTCGHTWHDTWIHVACHMANPTRSMTRLLTDGQLPLTGGPAVVNGGSPSLTVVDRRWPPLTATVDHRSTVVQRWLTGVDWWLTCHVVAMWRATSWRLANQRLPRSTSNHWYEVLFIGGKYEVQAGGSDFEGSRS
ncbi:hypothetical protein Tco_1332452 [Tanacetum coccineum]